MDPCRAVVPSPWTSVVLVALRQGLAPRAALRLVEAAPGGARQRPEHVCNLLPALAGLHDVSAAALWALRTGLASPTGSWRWPFDHLPDADAGWRADVALWTRCRETVPEARAFDAVAGATRAARVLRVLAEVRAERLAAGVDPTPLTAALAAAFAWRPSPGRPASANVPRPTPTPIPTPVPSGPLGVPPRRIYPVGYRPGWARPAASVPRPQTGAELGRNGRPLARALLAARPHPGNDALLDAFVGWLVGVHGGDPRALEALLLLDAKRISAARVALAAAATSNAPWTDAQRADALRHLLTNPSSTEAEAS